MSGKGAAATGSGGHQPVVAAAAALLGGTGFIAALGPELVHPENIDWLMRGDFSLHFLGWHVYRGGSWTLPVGATPNLIWPVGSSVGLTDSIPIASVFFKLLDPLLPPVFQFIGLWLASCFALQGLFGALLMQRVTPRADLQLLGALLFVLSPPLVFRFGHAALSAHWVILAALWLALRDDADVPAWHGALAWALLLFVTAAIQPYLLLMVAGVMGGAVLRQVLAAPAMVVAIAVHAAVALAAAYVGLWQSGSLMVPSESGLTMGGFGVYSANLFTFVMPTEGNTLFAPGPIRYASATQYEGYAYLGAGVLALAVVVLVTTLAAPRPAAWRATLWRRLPLLLALLGLAVIALGPGVTAGTRTLFAYDGRVWGPLLAFRTNGRMIWPLYYGVVAAVVFAAARLRPRAAAALLAGALALQAVDMAGMVPWMRDVGVFGYREPLASRFWTAAPRHYQRLVLVPSNVCDRDGGVDFRPFALLSGRTGLPLNAGSTARYDTRRAAEYCEALAREVRDGLRTEGTLYVVRRDLLPPDEPGRVCRVIDGFGVCMSAASVARWQQEFALPPR